MDVKTRDGQLKALLKYRFPLVLGNDLSGVVADVAVSEEAKKARARKMIRELRRLGYRVELLPAESSSPA